MSGNLLKSNMLRGKCLPSEQMVGWLVAIHEQRSHGPQMASS